MPSIPSDQFREQPFSLRMWRCHKKQMTELPIWNRISFDFLFKQGIKILFDWLTTLMVTPDLYVRHNVLRCAATRPVATIYHVWSHGAGRNDNDKIPLLRIRATDLSDLDEKRWVDSALSDLFNPLLKAFQLNWFELESIVSLRYSNNKGSPVDGELSEIFCELQIFPFPGSILSLNFQKWFSSKAPLVIAFCRSASELSSK